MKSEPDVYSLDDLAGSGPAMWEGCRSYQVRNLFRDEFSPGDLAFFHNSNAKPSGAWPGGIVGIMRVTSGAYPDPTQFDPESHYHDAKSPAENPRWLCVDVEFVERLPAPVSLADLRTEPSLAGMQVLRKGQRLSVMPVEPAEWEGVLALSGRIASARG